MHVLFPLPKNLLGPPLEIPTPKCTNYNSAHECNVLYCKCTEGSLYSAVKSNDFEALLSVLFFSFMTSVTETRSPYHHRFITDYDYNPTITTSLSMRPEYINCSRAQEAAAYRSGLPAKTQTDSEGITIAGGPARPSTVSASPGCSLDS